MAATIGAAPLEEENPTPMMDKKDPPKKAEAAVATTTEVPLVMPLADERMAKVVEEAPKKVEATKMAEEEEEVPKKVVASGQEKEEDIGLNGKGGAFWSQEVKNNEAEGDEEADESGKVEEAEGESSGVTEELALQDTETTVFVVEPTLTSPLESNDAEETEGADNDKVESDEGGDDGGEPEVAGEDAKTKTLDAEEVMKDDDNREPVAHDIEVAVPMVEPGLAVEYKSKSNELGEEDAAMGSPDALEGDDKGELWKEREEKVVATMEEKIADKMADDVKVAVIEEEKLESEGEKGEETGYGDGDGGELGEEKEVEISSISVEATKLGDEVAYFAKASSELGYEKEGSGDILIVGGKEAPEESTTKDVDVEIEVAKLELASEVVHGESVEEIYPASAQCVLVNSHGKEQNAEGQTNASEVVEEVGVEKPLEVENVAAVVEDISLEKPTEIKNVDIEVEGIDIEKPMEVENVIASSVDGILSQELAPEPSKENNNVEETEGATKVVNHEEEIDDDGIIDAMTNVIDAENDEAEGIEGADEGGEVEEVEEGAKGESSSAAEKPALQDIETTVFVVELTPTPPLEFNDAKDTGGATEVVDHENMVDDDIIKDVTSVIDAHNDNVEDDERGDADGVPEVAEEDAKARNLDVGEAMKDDGGREPVEQDVEVAAPVVKPAPTVEYKSERNELVEEGATMASPVAPEGEDKGELWKEQEEKVVAIVEAKVADKMAGDVKSALTEKEKRELEGEKDEEAGYGGGDGGELGERKEIEVSTISVDTTQLGDKVDEASGEVGYEKEASGDIRIVEGEQALEESTKKDVDVKDEFAKPELASEVVHGGSAEKVYPASAHSVLDNSHGNEKSVDGKTNASEVVEEIGVEKPLEVENIDGAVEYIGFEEPTKIENIAIEVEGIDDEIPIDIENATASGVDGILSRELAPESSKENNNVEETEGATKVVIHEEKVDDDGIIDAMTNVIDAKNNEAKGDKGGVDGAMPEKHAKGGSLGAVKTVKDDGGMEPVEQDTEVVISMVEMAPEQILEPKWGNSEIGENEDAMASPDASEGGDKGELKKELEEEVDVMVEVKVTDKVIDDAKATVIEEEKELESEKGEELDYGGGDGGKLGKDKEVKASTISDKVVLFAKPYGELGYGKEASNDIVVLGGEEAQVESIKEYVYVEDVAVKHDPTSKANTMVLHDGSLDEVDPASRDSVLEDSPEKDQNVEGQQNASKAMEHVGADKPLYVEVATTIENIDVEKPIELEIVAVVVEDVDVEKPMEVENVVAYSDDGIISQELVAESSKENNDDEKTEDATEDVDHIEEVLDDNIIGTVTNVTDAENDDVEGDKEGGDDGVVEEAEEDAKDKSLGEAKAMKDDGGTEPTMQDKKVVTSMIELGPVLVVESKLEHGEFEEDAMASSDATEGEDKDEWQEKNKLDVMVEAKIVDNAKSAVAGEEKLEPEGEKGEEIGYEGGDGGELGEEKYAEVSTISVEDKVIPFVEGNSELDYDKEASDDIVAMGGEEVMEESIEKDVDVENEAAKPEPVREASTMVVHDGSVQVADPTSVDRALKDSTGKEQNAERYATSEALEDISVEKILEVENVATRVEDIGIKKPIEVENIVVEVEDVDVKKSMEDENVAASSANDILSREPAPKSKKEKNDVEKTEDATKVIDHEEKIDDDGIIEDLKNVTDTKNNEVECDRGGDDEGEVEDVEEETKDRSLDVAEDVKDNDEKKLMVQDVEAVISVVESGLASIVESQSENSELGEDDATVASFDALEGEDKDEFLEEQKEEKVGASVEVKMVYKVGDDVKVAVVEQNKPKSEDGKGDEVGYGGEDSGELGEEKDAKVSVEADEPEDEVALLSKDEGELDYKKEASNDTMIVGGEKALEESIGKDVAIQDEVAKPKLVSEASIEVVHDGSVVEVDLASANSVLEDSPAKEQNAEGMSTASEAMEDGGVKKPLGDENIVVVVEDIGVEKHIELENIVIPEEDIDVEKPVKVENAVVSGTDGILFRELAPESNIENNDAGEMEGATEVVDYEDDINDDIRIKVVTDDENGAGDEADDGANSNTSGSSHRNNIFSSQDDSRILIMNRPAGLGSSASSLWPTPPDETAQSKILNISELALTDARTEEMNEEDKKVNDKVELIKINFLRLVYRLGATLEETVAAQVMYRLSLAEGIIHGWQMNRAFNFDNAQKKALILEAEGKHDLNFSCNILVLGKTGVGKSATINSIFGEEKLKTDAFNSATTSVQEIVGDVHGVKIRIIDTPGLLPNVMDQASNRKILVAVKKYTRKCPPDIVLYVDRLDCLSRDLNDLPLLKTITDILGSSIWFNAIAALTHAASPPEGLNGTPMPYEVLMAQSSHIIQQSIRQATRDMRLMNPVALVENHPSCRRNSESQKVLPNDQSWRHQMLLLCYSAKILSEANSLLKLHDPNPEKLSGFHFHSQPLHFLLSSLLQSRAHPKLSIEQGGNEGNSDVELDDCFDVEQDDGEEEYSQFPPFKPLTKTQLARLTKEQKNVCFDGYDSMVKLFQKKQWKDEIRRLKEMKKRGTDLDDYGRYANIVGENDQDPPPKSVSVPLPDIVLPPSFDCDNPTYRYRFLETTSTVLSRPILDAHGWDHDCGYDGISMEDTLAILNRFPGNVDVQVTKNKKEFSIRLDSSIAAKHGENASSLAGFDIQTVGQQLAYILYGETKIKNIKKNKTTGGFSVTFLGDIVATGLKVEDQLSLGKRLSLVASTGAMQAQGDTAYGANLEACLKDKDYPIGQSLSTLGLCLMKWRQDLALGANLQSQFSTGRGSKMALRLGLNNKLSGKITVKTSTSEQVQIALLGLVPVAASIYRSFRPREP